MLEELRWIPRSPATRSSGRLLGLRAAIGGGEVDPSLSTGFAERIRVWSPGSRAPIHSPLDAVGKEEVG